MKSVSEVPECRPVSIVILRIKVGFADRIWRVSRPHSKSSLRCGHSSVPGIALLVTVNAQRTLDTMFCPVHMTSVAVFVPCAVVQGEDTDTMPMESPVKLKPVNRLNNVPKVMRLRMRGPNQVCLLPDPEVCTHNSLLCSSSLFSPSAMQCKLSFMSPDLVRCLARL